MRLPLILMYHIVAPCPADADGVERGLFVDPASFEAQMQDLAARGYATVSLDQFAASFDGVPISPKSVLLTFDDGYAHVDQVVAPVLRRYGLSAVMFACPGHLGGKNTWDEHHPNLSNLEIASRDQLKSMASGPWEIASHGRHHVDLRRLDFLQRLAELSEARAELSEIVGKPVVDFAYPFGLNDAAVRHDVRAAGYRLAFTAWHATDNDRMGLGRRPIKGTDSLTTFRLKTSHWSDALYRARGAARSLTGAGAR